MYSKLHSVVQLIRLKVDLKKIQWDEFLLFQDLEKCCFLPSFGTFDYDNGHQLKCSLNVGENYQLKN